MSEARLITRPFLWLVLGHFLQALGYASAPLLPLYLAYLGASLSQIGMIMASAAIGGLALRPAVGWALDTLGRRPTLISSTLLLAVSMIALGLVDTIGPLVYVLRVLFGVAVGALFTAYFTAVSDIVPPARRTEGIALFGVSGLVPLAINPAIGEMGLAAASLRWVFPILGVIVAASLIALMRVQETREVDDDAGAADVAPKTLSVVLRALRARPLWPVWLATVIFAGLVSSFMTFASVTAAHRGIENSGGLWLTYACGACAVRLFGGRLPDRLGPANLVAPSLAAYGIAMVLIASGESSGDFLLAGALAGVGHGYCFPVLTSQVVQRAAPGLRGSTMSMFTALWDVSAIALTPALGLLADQTSEAFMFAVAANFAFIGLVLWLPLEAAAARARRRVES